MSLATAAPARAPHELAVATAVAAAVLCTRSKRVVAATCGALCVLAAADPFADAEPPWEFWVAVMATLGIVPAVVLGAANGVLHGGDVRQAVHDVVAAPLAALSTGPAPMAFVGMVLVLMSPRTGVVPPLLLATAAAAAGVDTVHQLCVGAATAYAAPLLAAFLVAAAFGTGAGQRRLA